MQRIAMLTAALLAVSASAQTTKIVYEYGSEEIGNLSGKGGTKQAKASSSKTDLPNTGDPTYFNIRQIQFEEESDRPCSLWINDRTAYNGIGLWNQCKGRGGATPQELKLANDDQRFHGVQVCMNADKDRIKGVRLYVSEFEGDSARKTLVKKKAQVREFKRPNCDEKDGWMQEQRCGDGMAMTGLVIDYREGKGVGDTSDVATGLSPICRKVTKRTLTTGN